MEVQFCNQVEFLAKPRFKVEEGRAFVSREAEGGPRIYVGYLLKEFGDVLCKDGLRVVAPHQLRPCSVDVVLLGRLDWDSGCVEIWAHPSIPLQDQRFGVDQERVGDLDFACFEDGLVEVTERRNWLLLGKEVGGH